MAKMRQDKVIHNVYIQEIWFKTHKIVKQTVMLCTETQIHVLFITAKKEMSKTNEEEFLNLGEGKCLGC